MASTCSTTPTTSASKPSASRRSRPCSPRGSSPTAALKRRGHRSYPCTKTRRTDPAPALPPQSRRHHARQDHNRVEAHRRRPGWATTTETKLTLTTSTAQAVPRARARWRARRSTTHGTAPCRNANTAARLRLADGERRDSSEASLGASMHDCKGQCGTAHDRAPSAYPPSATGPRMLSAHARWSSVSSAQGRRPPPQERAAPGRLRRLHRARSASCLATTAAPV